MKTLPDGNILQGLLFFRRTDVRAKAMFLARPAHRLTEGPIARMIRPDFGETPMRALIVATALAASTAPALALAPPATPRQAAGHEPMRQLPDDWLDDTDLDGTADQAAGGEADDRLAGGERGARDADLAGECRESSGTTGAIIGAVAGGILGNVIDGGGHRAAGTLVGAGGGALLGRSIEKKRAAAQCR
jgi:hypothetical protein